MGRGLAKTRNRRQEGCPGARSKGGPGSPHRCSGPSYSHLRGGHAGGRAPVTLVEVGSSSGSFPFSCGLHPSHEQHFGQNWNPPALCMPSSRFGDHCGLMMPSLLSPASGLRDPCPQKDDGCSKAPSEEIPSCEVRASLPPCPHRPFLTRASFCTEFWGFLNIRNLSAEARVGQISGERGRVPVDR